MHFTVFPGLGSTLSGLTKFLTSQSQLYNIHVTVLVVINYFILVLSWRFGVFLTAVIFLICEILPIVKRASVTVSCN